MEPKTKTVVYSKCGSRLVQPRTHSPLENMYQFLEPRITKTKSITSVSQTNLEGSPYLPASPPGPLPTPAFICHAGMLGVATVANGVGGKLALIQIKKQLFRFCQQKLSTFRESRDLYTCLFKNRDLTMPSSALSSRTDAWRLVDERCSPSRDELMRSNVPCSCCIDWLVFSRNDAIVRSNVRRRSGNMYGSITFCENTFINIHSKHKN